MKRTKFNAAIKPGTHIRFLAGTNRWHKVTHVSDDQKMIRVENQPAWFYPNQIETFTNKSVNVN